MARLSSTIMQNLVEIEQHTSVWGDKVFFFCFRVTLIRSEELLLLLQILTSFAAFLGEDKSLPAGEQIWKVIARWCYDQCTNVRENFSKSEKMVAKFVCTTSVIYKVAQKTGPPSHCKYSEIPWPNWVEIGELLQYYMLNTFINFLFKNFIALWRHLAKTQLLSFIHIVQIDLSITQ